MPKGDVRTRPRPVGTASQHRVYAALREFCNFEMRKTRRLAFNPVYTIELEHEITPEAWRWSAAEAARFSAASADDPLGLLFRVVVLRGARRGQAIGFPPARRGPGCGIPGRRAAGPADRRGRSGGAAQVACRAAADWLDAATVRLLREHRKAQLMARMRAGEAWQDNDLVFCKDEGTPWNPDYESRRFRTIARAVSLPVIKLHEGRHSAASLATDAAVDPEIRRRTLRQADQAMTSHYTHI